MQIIFLDLVLPRQSLEAEVNIQEQSLNLGETLWLNRESLSVHILIRCLLKVTRMDSAKTQSALRILLYASGLINAPYHVNLSCAMIYCAQGNVL